MSKLDFASMKKEALSPEFQPKKMDVKFTSRIANSYRNVKSKNVVELVKRENLLSIVSNLPEKVKVILGAGDIGIEVEKIKKRLKLL